MLTLYNAFFLSHLSYGIAAWGGSANCHISKLLSKQNKILNLLPGNDRPRDAVSRTANEKLVTIVANRH